MLRIAALLAVACVTLSGESVSPRIFYSKNFPGSVPALVLITVERNGRTEYKEAADDDQPFKFQIDTAAADEIFALADKLDRFKRPLESGLKVANTGIKTFRYENSSDGGEVKFNYSLDENARLLQDWFERIVETQQHLINLERTARFDKLGVHKVLLQLESSYGRGRLIAPEQFLTTLDKVVRNGSYMNMARERAANLAEAFRNGKPKTE